jgi:hypothetical protein
MHVLSIRAAISVPSIKYSLQCVRIASAIEADRASAVTGNGPDVDMFSSGSSRITRLHLVWFRPTSTAIRQQFGSLASLLLANVRTPMPREQCSRALCIVSYCSCVACDKSPRRSDCACATSDPKRAVDNCHRMENRTSRSPGVDFRRTKMQFSTGNFTDTRPVVTSINCWNEIGTAAGNGGSLVDMTKENRAHWQNDQRWQPHLRTRQSA